jgi:DNA-directed RNA polymerase III subunit RPC8
MKDIVHVKPWQFDQDLTSVIEDELNKKLANKVIYQVGLCVALFDIKHIGESFVFPGDGSSHTQVIFRYVVFRPFIDEVLIGKVKSCSKEGVHVTMSFFDDIFIPASNLQKPSKFDEREQLFIWQYDTGDSVHDLYLDIGELVRFKVVGETFVDTTPNGPPKRMDAVGVSQSGTKEDARCPYSITGSINESGLGLLSWWNN